MMKQKETNSENYIYNNKGVFRVAIDCDDTILVFGRKYWETHNNKFNDNVNHKKVNRWGFEKFVKASVTIKDTIETLYTNGLFRNLRLRRAARKLMDTLYKENFSIYLVTDVPPARENIDPRQDRKDNIKEKFPWYDLEKMHFTSEKDKTGLGLLVLLDDKPETYFKFLEQGKNIILIDAPHNRYIKNVKYRATNLEQALEFVLQIRAEYLEAHPEPTAA